MQSSCDTTGRNRMVTEPPEATLAVEVLQTNVVTSIIRSDCYRLERQLPGGIRTR